MLSLGERIADSYAELSPQEQRAADFLRDHLADLAVYNATEVARLSGVSKATISRLYRRLGFENAEQLRDHVRVVRASGIPVASDTPTSFPAHLDQEIGNLRAALEALAAADLGVLSSVIAGARRVLVIGFRNSYPVALHLRQQLAQARDGVALAPQPGQSLGEELAGLTADDTVILVGFRRRPETFGRVVAAAVESPARVILMTDDGGRTHSAGADHTLIVPVDSVSAFDSYAAANSIVSLLASAVLGVNLREGRSRIAVIGEVYTALDEIEGA